MALRMDRTIITLPQLAQIISANLGLEYDSVHGFLRNLFLAISERLISHVDEKVELNGIGCFISIGDGIKFIPAPEIEQKINEQFSIFEPFVLEDDNEIQIAQRVTHEPTIPALSPEPLVEVAPESITRIEPMMDEPDIINENNSSDEESSSRNNSNFVASDRNASSESEFIRPVERADHPRSYRFGWLCAGIVIGVVIGWLGAVVYESRFTELMSPEIEAEVAGRPVIEPDVVMTEPAQPVQSELLTDTVTTTKYITHMAKKYYGDRIFWVYIYEANKNELGHPERTLPGTVVRIPSPDSIPANPLNAEDIKKARRLASEIYNRFQ